MKEHPILFSAPMVRSILEGRKTMTRRTTWLEHINQSPNHWYIDADGLMADRTTGELMGINEEGGMRPYQIMCPYGHSGDLLWVRETFTANLADCVLYKAEPQFDSMIDGECPWKWTPSIFMPRAYSRTLLEVAAIRVERLHDISEADAKAEGAEAKRWLDLRQASLSLIGGKGSAIPSDPRYRYGFYELWDSINAKRGYGWDANPWVWVIEFERIEVST